MSNYAKRNIFYLYLRVKALICYLVSNRAAIFRKLKKALSPGYIVYDLGDLNIQYLSFMIAHITAKPVEEISGYIDEILNDQQLYDHFAAQTREKNWAHSMYGEKLSIGRRVGWYALVRAKKPSVVVESGVAAGIGACVLSKAIERNTQDGHPGRYYGLEINPDQGMFFSGPYLDHGEILIGDAIETISNFDKDIDVLITDASHSQSFEIEELKAANEKLSAQGVILANNAHNRNALAEYSREQGREFLFFREEAACHWRPVAGIGFSFVGPQAAPQSAPGS